MRPSVYLSCIVDPRNLFINFAYCKRIKGVLQDVKTSIAPTSNWIDDGTSFSESETKRDIV